MADSRYKITYRSGLALDAWTAQLWDKLKKRLPNLILTQGVRSGAAASGGTHLGLGVLDLYLGGHDWKAVLKYAFEIGFFGWYRPTLPGVWKAHVHLGVRGHPGMAASLKAQQNSWANKRNGLVGNGPDFYTWRPANYKSAAPFGKPTTITAMQFNLPGPDKIGNSAARIKAAVRLVKKGNPHLIGWNELEGIKRAGVASTFAHDVDAALGKKWKLVKPTKKLNENYISYRGDRLTVVKQYDDSILESRTGGRHLTRVVFRHANGLVFAVGQTHLVNDGGTQGERDRQTQGVDALESMRAVSAKHDDCPILLQGDMNLSADLSALVEAGWKRTRKFADKSDGRLATYTNYTKTKPSTSTAWEIDQQYVSPGFYVHTYKVLRDLVKGLFRKPRASDHDAIVSSFSA